MARNLPKDGSTSIGIFRLGPLAAFPASLKFYRGFCFETHWVNMPGFMDTVATAWEQPVNIQNALLRMHVKLMRTARALKIWRRSILVNGN